MGTLYPATGFAQMLPEEGILCNTVDKRFRLGGVVMDIYGNFFRYVQASEALAVGEIVTHVPLGTWDTSIVVDGAIVANTTNKLHIDTTTTVMTADQYVDYSIAQAVAAGKGRLYRIIKHPAIAAATGEGDLTLAEDMTEAFADGTALEIVNPFLVELVDANTDTIAGVAVGTITTDYFGFVQVGGIHNGVLCDGSNGTPLILNETVSSYGGTDPGQGQGYATADEAGDQEVANSPLIAMQDSAVDAGYVPCKFARVV
jgi:hypothetical protein